MSWKNDPVTKKQLELLGDLGYLLTRPKTKGDASTLIDALKAGLSAEVAQDRMFRYQVGIPLEPLPQRNYSGKTGCGLSSLLIVALIFAVVIVFVT